MTFPSPRYQLIIAAREGDIDRVIALLDQGVAVDFQDGNSMTPLHHASERGDIAVATLLLDAGANVNAMTEGGQWTPLFRASTRGHLDTVQLLVSRGADIHHRVAGGYSCLLFAALQDRLPICEYFLSVGADLMMMNNGVCWTALTHYGHNIYPPLSPEIKAIRCAALEAWWVAGPSQVQRRRDELWERRGPLLTVLAEHAYRPLQARALEIELAALSLDPNEPVLISTKPKEVILHDEGMVRYIVGFL
jgi:hypothetical protein